MTLSETSAFAARLAEGPPIAQRLAKHEIYRGLEMSLEAALEFAIACVNIALATEDHAEGIRAFAEGRPPVFLGR